MNEQERNDLIRYRIMHSKETMKEVEMLIKNDFLNAAVNRLYYACFYAISALLLKNNKLYLQLLPFRFCNHNGSTAIAPNICSGSEHIKNSVNGQNQTDTFER